MSLPMSTNADAAPPAYDEAVAESLTENAHDIPPTLPPRPGGAESSPAPALPARHPSNSAAPPYPTRQPEPGHPLLYNNKLLVYPQGAPVCSSCGCTGYKAGDPSRPCRKCWSKFGREFDNVLKHAYDTNNTSFLTSMVLQRPLYSKGPGYAYNFATSWEPGYGLLNSFNFPGTSYVSNNGYGNFGNDTYYRIYQQPGLYGQLGQGRPYVLPNGHYYAPNMAQPTPYGQPSHSTTPAQPAVPPPRQEVFPEDAHTDAPPRYDVASSTKTDSRLPQQEYPHPPQPPMPQSPPPIRPPVAPTTTPLVYYHNRLPPTGAISVLPGDPRIGGVLCPVCGGAGDVEQGYVTANSLLDLFTGPRECWRCQGSGRVQG